MPKMPPNSIEAHGSALGYDEPHEQLYTRQEKAANHRWQARALYKAHGELT